MPRVCRGWLTAASCALVALELGCGESAEHAPLAACPTDQVTAQDGTCRPVGVPPSLCPDGFVAEQGSCLPVLPAEPCPDGLMALPGDEACQEVWPCGEGRWGDIPIEPGTQFVDHDYAVGDGDGSEERPWQTVREGIEAAPPGGMVAVAAGTYVEHAFIAGKSVRLWGRCPALVEIVGPPGAFAGVDLGLDAGATEVRGVSISGSAFGLALTGAEDVVVEGVRVHDTPDVGIEVDDTLGPTSATLRRILVERTVSSGLLLFSARLDIDGLVVRGTLPEADGRFGRGLSVAGSPPYAVRAELALTRAVIQRNHEAGMVLEGTDATLAAVVVEDTLPQASSGLFGRGAAFQSSSVRVTGSVFQRNVEYGMNVAAESDAIVEATVIADTRYHDGSGRRGGGLAVYRASAEVRYALLEGGHTFGVSVADGSAELEGVLIRNVQADGEDQFGDGLLAVSFDTRSSLALSRSRIVDSARAGVGNFGGAIELFEDELRCNRVELHGDAHQGHAFEYTDRGGNTCGCAAETTAQCQVQVAGLQPPAPPE